jgi:hypothetical protein
MKKYSKITKENLKKLKEATLEEIVDNEELMEIFSQVMESMETSPIIMNKENI